MNYVIDSVLVAIMLFCVVFYSVKGFISSVVGLFRFWIAAALAGVFSKPLTERLHPIIVDKLGMEEGGNFVSEIVKGVISSGYISRVVAFSLVFAAVLIALKLLELIMNLLSKLPVIRFLNRTLGTAVGVVVGVFWVQLIALVLMACGELFGDTVPFLAPDVLNGTVLAKFLYEHNLFRLVFESLTGLAT